jgi:serine protease AprX
MAVFILLAPCLMGGTITRVTTAIVPATTRVERIDPRITHIARTAPKQEVRIIVQKLGSDQDVEKRIAGLGGNILSDLPILNAIVAELSADSAYQLAQSPSVRWISIDAQVHSTLLGLGDTNKTEPSNSYLGTLGIPSLWQRGLSGQDIGIAVIDSGIARDNDFTNLALTKGFNLNSLTPTDLYGHGTHIAGIVAGNGNDSNGKYKGIAPSATLIGLKVSDDLGVAFESDVVKALQWVYDNRAQYNIRIINLSINSGVEASYHHSPLNAAAEILWFSGVVVIVSAGNSGEQHGYNTI